jgi:hypothetical protein
MKDEYSPIIDFDKSIHCQTIIVELTKSHIETERPCGTLATFYVKGLPGNYWSGWHCDSHALAVIRHMGHQGGCIAVPIMHELECGPTGDEMFCACGCGGDDSRCIRYMWYYQTDRQVPEDHVCCKVPGR